MCEYCSGKFVGDKPITPISSPESGIELVVEGGFIYAYCECGIHSVEKIKYCPVCGEEL